MLMKQKSKMNQSQRKRLSLKLTRSTKQVRQNLLPKIVPSQKHGKKWFCAFQVIPWYLISQAPPHLQFFIPYLLNAYFSITNYLKKVVEIMHWFYNCTCMSILAANFCWVGAFEVLALFSSSSGYFETSAWKWNSKLLKIINSKWLAKLKPVARIDMRVQLHKYFAHWQTNSIRT